MESRDPWPAQGIKHNTSIDDYTWGYLIHRNDTFHFDDSERPSKAEVMHRWGAYLTGDSLEADTASHAENASASEPCGSEA